MSEVINNRQQRIDIMKGLIRQLHAGTAEEKIKKQLETMRNEADLHQHIHLENNILFPKVLELQREMVGKEQA